MKNKIKEIEKEIEDRIISVMNKYNMDYDYVRLKTKLKTYKETRLEAVNEMIEFLKKRLIFLVKAMSKTSYTERYFNFVEEVHKPQVKEVRQLKEEMLEEIELLIDKLEELKKNKKKELEEKKEMTLSEEIVSDGIEKKFLHIKDVREFIKKINYWIDFGLTGEVLKEKIKEEAGEELL